MRTHRSAGHTTAGRGNPRPCAVMVAVLSLATGAAGATARYAVTDLGLPPNATAAVARGLNGSGVVVGSVTLPGGTSEAFRWQNGTMQLLGWLPQGRNSIATGINAAGVIVGDSDTSDVEPRAVVWTDGTAGSVRDLTRSQNGSNIHAVGINASGVIAGYFRRAGGGTRPWEALTWGPVYDGKFALLGDPPGADPAVVSLIAEALNDAGTVAGWGSINNTMGQRGWRHSTTTGYDVLGLTNVAGAQNSYAYGINAGGDVVGYVVATVSTPGGFVSSNRAFLAVGDVMTDLGLLPGTTDSQALGINGHREIVGVGSDAAGTTLRAYVRLGAQLLDLNDLVDPNAGWTLQQASAINEAGQIVGFGTHLGQTRAFLLTPIAGPGAVPDGAAGSSPLTLSRHAGDPARLDLAWGATCGATANDYAVYEGAMGAWASHDPDTCSTLGSTHATVTAVPGNRYFLVVPVGSETEGSYGRDSAGSERPASVHACFAGFNPNRCP